MIKSIVSEFGQLGCYEGEYEDKDFTYYSLSNNGAPYTLIVEKSTGRRFFKSDDNLANILGYNSMQEALQVDEIMDFYIQKEKEEGYWILK